MCDRMKLDPATRPFEYIELNGKLVLYARKSCAEQLRRVHGISVTECIPLQVGEVYVVTVKVQNSKGRTDTATGAVTIGHLKGDKLCNAMMKAETKAKRRATLSICALGMLDETEIETVPQVGDDHSVDGGSNARKMLEAAKPDEEPKEPPPKEAPKQEQQQETPEVPFSPDPPQQTGDDMDKTMRREIANFCQQLVMDKLRVVHNADSNIYTLWELEIDELPTNNMQEREAVLDNLETVTTEISGEPGETIIGVRSTPALKGDQLLRVYGRVKNLDVERTKKMIKGM